MAFAQLFIDLSPRVDNYALPGSNMVIRIRGCTRPRLAANEASLLPDDDLAGRMQKAT